MKYLIQQTLHQDHWMLSQYGNTRPVDEDGYWIVYMFEEKTYKEALDFFTKWVSTHK